MKFLKWFLGVFVVFAIGDIGTKLLSHRQGTIDKTMQELVTQMGAKLPLTNDLGLTMTRISYAANTLTEYYSVPKGTNPDQYKQQITDKVCVDKVLWMFQKGFRIENIFQFEGADAFSPDLTLVIDAAQCKHRGEVSSVVPSAPAPAPATQASIVPTAPATPYTIVPPAPAAAAATPSTDAAASPR